jgi:hypothetical protein
MTEEMLRTVLETAQAKADKEGNAALPPGRLLTLYTAHAGVGLTVGKVERLRISGGSVRAHTVKGDTFLLALEDVFAAAVEGTGEPGAQRKAGFLG